MHVSSTSSTLLTYAARQKNNPDSDGDGGLFDSLTDGGGGCRHGSDDSLLSALGADDGSTGNTSADAASSTDTGNQFQAWLAMMMGKGSTDASADDETSVQDNVATGSTTSSTAESSPASTVSTKTKTASKDSAADLLAQLESLDGGMTLFADSIKDQLALPGGSAS